MNTDTNTSHRWPFHTASNSGSKTPRGPPGDGCVYSGQAALRLLVSGGPAWTPGEEDRVWGHTVFLSQGQGTYSAVSPAAQGRGPREKEWIPRCEPRPELDQIAFLNGVGQRRGAGGREGARSRAGDSLSATALPSVRRAGAPPAPGPRPQISHGGNGLAS